MRIRNRALSIALMLIMAIGFAMMSQSEESYAATNVGYGGTSYANARHLQLGKAYYGTASGDAYHYFKFRTSGNRNVSYKFWGINYGEYVGHVSVYILDGDGNKVDSFFIHIGGMPETAVFRGLKRNTTYYLRVGNFRLGDDNFSLRISQIIHKPAKATIRSAKTGKKSMTVSWKAVSNANKYQVQYRKAGTSKWTTKMTTKRSITIKGLKKGKTYQVRVRAIRVVSSKNYSGAFSAKVVRKVK